MKYRGKPIFKLTPWEGVKAVEAGKKPLTDAPVQIYKQMNIKTNLPYIDVPGYVMYYDDNYPYKHTKKVSSPMRIYYNPKYKKNAQLVASGYKKQYEEEKRVKIGTPMKGSSIPPASVQRKFGKIYGYNKTDIDKFVKIINKRKKKENQIMKKKIKFF